MANENAPQTSPAISISLIILYLRALEADP